jgi:hypothetical protein
MRRCWTVLLLGCVPLAALPACKEQGAEPLPAPPASADRSALASLALGHEHDHERARPVSSALVALEKTLQQDKLAVPARSSHAPQLAFGKGALGRLTRDALEVYDSADFRLLATEPLESPRAVVALADGSLLALGVQRMLRWERDKKAAARLSKPVLLPEAQLYPDAQQADLLWIFDGQGQGGTSARPPTLSSYRLTPDDSSLRLPEQTIELTSPRGGVFGVTREGVWLYCTPRHVERLSPGGLRLPGFALEQARLPTWVAPARRLDQSLWLDETGRAARVLVSPSFKLLSSVQLRGLAVDFSVGDEGRLAAVVVVSAPGPRFELLLLDHALAQQAEVVLPADAPTGADDWVKVVTENQNVVVAAKGGQVAVGGPARVTIFDAGGKQLFSIPSR